MKVDKETEDIETPEESRSNNYPSLTIDWRLYEEYLDSPQLTDEQKREFIEALWYIIVSFVDLGFGVHPVQHVLDGCGLDADLAECGQSTLLSSWDRTKTNNPNAADRDDCGRPERKET